MSDLDPRFLVHQCKLFGQDTDEDLLEVACRRKQLWNTAELKVLHWEGMKREFRWMPLQELMLSQISCAIAAHSGQALRDSGVREESVPCLSMELCVL